MRALRSIDPDLCRAFVDGVIARLDVEAVVLFGSRVRDEALADSDYDIIVVTEAVDGMPRRARLGFLGDIWVESLRMACLPFRSGDIHGYTHAEILSMGFPLVWDALDCGVVLLDRGAWDQAVRLRDRLRQEGALTSWADGSGWNVDLERIRALAATSG